MGAVRYLVGSLAAGLLVAAVSCADDDPNGSTGGSGGVGGSAGGTGGAGAAGGTGGSGGGSAAQTPFGSGTRLHARYMDGGNGAERFHTFYDSELEQTCSFAQDGDGVGMCAPSHNADIAYLDAACTQPVSLSYTCSPAPPAYVSHYGERGCPSDVNPPDIYEVGSLSTPTTVYTEVDGACEEMVGFDPPTTTVHEVSLADTSLFMRGQLQSTEGEGGLGQRVVRYDDGAFRVQGGYHIESDEACNLDVIDDEHLCVPISMGFGVQRSTSDTCDVVDVAYTVFDSTCGPPRAITRYTPPSAACEPFTRTLHAVGDPIDDSLVYQGPPGSCSLVQSGGFQHYLIGEPSRDQAPAFSTTVVGTGRLTLTGLTSSDGLYLRLGHETFFDTERDAPCTVWDTAEGKKCIPIVRAFEGQGTGYFSDDLCSVPLVSLSVCDAAFEAIGFYDVADTCAEPVMQTLYEFGPLHMGTVYTGDTANCTAQPVSSDFEYYEVGAAIAWDSLASLQEVTAAP